jgi:polar amino acid transport system substrate-binding protein
MFDPAIRRTEDDMSERIGRREIVAALPVAVAAAWFGVGPVKAASQSGTAPADVVAALAPNGRIRAAINLGNEVLAQRDPKTGIVSGVIVDITNELARRLGTPVDSIYYDTGGKIAPAQPTDRWTISYLGTEQSRVAGFVVTEPYLTLDGTYLVRANSRFRSVADLDQDGVQIATALNSAYDQELSRMLKHAKLVRAPTSLAAIELFERQGLEAAAGVRQALVTAQKSAKDLRVLPDAYTHIDQAVTIPKGHDSTLRYLQALVAELKASGFIKSSLDKSGQSAGLVPAK